MTDTLSREERSARMALVRHKDTKPEMVVRKLVHRLGYRYRLHGATLPGKPDLVFKARRKILFVHGCFWHRHAGCALARLPKSRPEFWVAKLEANRLRDRRTRLALKRDGWDCAIIWECEIKDTARLERRVRAFLGT